MELVSAREYLGWKIYFDKREEAELHQVSKQDVYLAQIATEVRRSWVKTPRLIKLKDFILKFKGEAEDLPPEKRVKRSKQYWLSMFGIKDE